MDGIKFPLLILLSSRISAAWNVLLRDAVAKEQEQEDVLSFFFFLKVWSIWQRDAAAVQDGLMCLECTINITDYFAL